MSTCEMGGGGSPGRADPAHHVGLRPKNKKFLILLVMNIFELPTFESESIYLNFVDPKIGMNTKMIEKCGARQSGEIRNIVVLPITSWRATFLNSCFAREYTKMIYSMLF